MRTTNDMDKARLVAEMLRLTTGGAVIREKRRKIVVAYGPVKIGRWTLYRRRMVIRKSGALAV